MVTAQDIESYLIRMGVEYKSIADNTWMINDEYDTIDNLVISLNDPIVLFHVRLMEIPEGTDRLRLFETLLRLNAEDMLHGAYGLEGNCVVVTDTLQAENLDFNEFQASVEAVLMSIALHYYGGLSKFVPAASSDASATDSQTNADKNAVKHADKADKAATSL